MARAVKWVRPNVIEVPQYVDHRTRVASLCMGIFLVLVFVFSFASSEGAFSARGERLKDDYEYVFDFEERTRKAYRAHWATSLEGHTTEDEFVDRQVNGKRHRFIKRYSIYSFFGSIALVLFALALFYPRACPMHFDRNREIAYTWPKGRLYVADIGPYLGGLRANIESSREGGIKVFHEDKRTGPVAITLVDSTAPESTHKFCIGPYPVSHSHQNHDLIMFIQAFMSKYLYNKQNLNEPWNDEWLQKLNHSGFFIQDPLRALGKRTLGPKHCFDEAKTEAAIMEYLTHPSTRSRGKAVRS